MLSSIHTKIKKTRFKELCYEHRGDHWRFLDANDPVSKEPLELAGIGSFYPTEKELLADLNRYAYFYGADGATAPEHTCPSCGHQFSA
jgi:hypothetical protein